MLGRLLFLYTHNNTHNNNVTVKQLNDTNPPTVHQLQSEFTAAKFVE